MPAPLIIAGAFITSLVVSFALPRPVLPILALVGSTVTLQWSADEYFFLSAWKSLAHERPSSSSKDEGHQLLQLGRWYLSWSESWGTMFPIVALPVTVVSGSRLAWTHHINGSSREIVAAYTIGTILAFAHVPAGQKAFPLVGKLRRAGEEYRSTCCFLRCEGY